MIDAAYLAGPWCHTHTLAGGEREEENRNYIFSEDGSLMYQVSEMSPEIGGRGKFTIDGDRIVISPTFSMFKLTVKSAEPDEMVLDAGLGDFYFRRGACA